MRPGDEPEPDWVYASPPEHSGGRVYWPIACGRCGCRRMSLMVDGASVIATCDRCLRRAEVRDPRADS